MDQLRERGRVKEPEAFLKIINMDIAYYGIFIITWAMFFLSQAKSMTSRSLVSVHLEPECLSSWHFPPLEPPKNTPQIKHKFF
ncbi:hypothetical protein QQP08_020345 [Theobroma cacao]|nr:hypothetical protein QQP08_020345 [Theobroma cacao]